MAKARRSEKDSRWTKFTLKKVEWVVSKGSENTYGSNENSDRRKNEDWREILEKDGSRQRQLIQYISISDIIFEYLYFYELTILHKYQDCLNLTLEGNNVSNTDLKDLPEYARTRDGLWTRALDTMSYHRKMMNEYLCRNYLAREILDTLNNQTIDKRLGRPSSGRRLMRESMLEDSGSRKYKDWLSRSTTLQDIYRHYEGMSDGDNPVLQGSQTVGDGEVTGYALLGEKVAGHGLGDFGSGYGYHSYEHFDDDEEHGDNGVKLKELFDLALTAIAFLAFGTFVTESMIYGFGVQNQEAQMMIVSPMPGVNGISFKSNYEDPLIPNQEGRSFSDPNVLNEMSRRVLASIEALLIANRDGGDCLKRVLCESNKYSRTLSGTQKIWLPIWSFGASWIAGKFTKVHDYSLLENLKAVLFGFGDADCRRLYDNCDGKLREKRK